MKVLQLGSGSMGTRRLRDLHRRPGITVALFDEREDRRRAATERFGIQAFSRLEDALAWKPEALVISTPPGTKRTYVDLAAARGLHHFIEADMWTYGQASRQASKADKAVVSAPSASLTFLPIVKELQTFVRDELGSVLSYQCLMATYMPSWHATEGQEYYARHRNTAAAREMIPFELSWLAFVFSAATEVAGKFEKYGSLAGQIEDTWTLTHKLERGGVGQLIVTMACPVEYRRGSCFGTNGMATWDIYSGDVQFQSTKEKAPRLLNFGAIGAAVEKMYLDEINRYIDACLGKAEWPQTYALTQQSCATLAAAEKSSVAGKWVKVDQQIEPDVAPPVAA